MTFYSADHVQNIHALSMMIQIIEDTRTGELLPTIYLSFPDDDGGDEAEVGLDLMVALSQALGLARKKIDDIIETAEYEQP